MTKETDRSLTQLFDECCELLLKGESIGEVLARHPSEAHALLPMLQAVAEVRQFGVAPQRDAALADAGRARFVAAAQQLSRERQAGPLPWWRRLALWVDRLAAGLTQPMAGPQRVPAGLLAALLVFVLLGALGTGVVSASANALPGDTLYGVKLAAEQARGMFAQDPAARSQLLDETVAHRVAEAQAILQLRRQIARMPLAGRLDDFNAAEWLISGLAVRLDSQTVVTGAPRVGALVRGDVRAPGDGTLVAIRLSVESLSLPPANNAAAPLATPTPTLVPATATATVAPTLTATPTRLRPTATRTRPVADSVFYSPLPTQPRPTRTALPLPTVTPAVTVTATATPTPAPTAAPTYTPWPTAPREHPKVRIVDYVASVNGGQWTIGTTVVDTDGSTSFVGSPGVGDKVDCSAEVRDDGSYLAIEIRLIDHGAPTPWEATNVVRAKSGATWTIGGATVDVSAATFLNGEPAVGDWAHVIADRYPSGQILARTVEKLTPGVTQFSGKISAFAANVWVVGGRTLAVNGDTRISGATPAVGLVADVQALQYPDDSLLAQVIYVRPPATATSEPGPSATPSDTPVPPDPTTAPTMRPPIATATPPPPTATPGLQPVRPTPGPPPGPASAPTPTALTLKAAGWPWSAAAVAGLSSWRAP